MTEELAVTEDWKIRSQRTSRAIRGAWIGTFIASGIAAAAFAIGMYGDGAIRLAAFAVAAVSVAIAFAYGTYVYMRRVDELEREANLWGAYASLCIYIVLFLAKTVLEPIGVIIPYADMAIFAVVLTSFVGVFAWKRFR